MICGVDFSGARPKRRGIPLWQARVRFAGDRGIVQSVAQLSSQVELCQRILASPSRCLWAIDAPFGLPKDLVREYCDLGQPLWSPANIPAFLPNADGIKASGHRRGTDRLHRGTAAPFCKQLRPMTRAAIELLAVLGAAGMGVLPWDEAGRVFEVFPGDAAMALRLEGVTPNSYKRKSSGAVSLRRAMVGRLAAGGPGCFPPVDLTSEQRDLCIGCDDALDAVLAAVCLHWHLAHPEVAEAHVQEIAADWRVEGLIVGPGAVITAM